METSQTAVIGSHISLTLQDMDFHTGLIVGRGGKNFTLSGWDGGISWNHLGKDTAQSLFRGSGRNIKKEHILNFAASTAPWIAPQLPPLHPD
jgi:hypothetical protein